MVYCNRKGVNYEMRIRNIIRCLLCLCFLCAIVCLSSCNASTPDASSTSSDCSEAQTTAANWWDDITLSNVYDITLEPDRTDLPSYDVLSSLARGMTLDEVFALVGNPQRIVIQMMSSYPFTSLAHKSICYVYDSNDGLSVIVLYGYFAGSDDLVIINTVSVPREDTQQ